MNSKKVNTDLIGLKGYTAWIRSTEESKDATNLLGVKGEEIAKDILRKEGFFEIHDNNRNEDLDKNHIYYSRTFDFYAKRIGTRWRRVKKKIDLCYYCLKCRHHHDGDSEVGKRHREYGEKIDWVIDVKTTRGDRKGPMNLTLNQVLLGHLLANQLGFRVGLLEININTKDYQLIDLTEIVIHGLNGIIKGMSEGQKIPLFLLEKYTRDRFRRFQEEASRYVARFRNRKNF